MGSLGMGIDTLFENTPVEVVGNHTFSFIKCGVYLTCAVESQPSHKAFCWGVNARCFCLQAKCPAGIKIDRQSMPRRGLRGPVGYAPIQSRR